MNTFKEKLVSIKEVWFDEEPEQLSDIDIVHYYQRTNRIEYIEFDEFHTRLVDLNEDENVLWEKLGKNNRYKIKRASEKDHVTYQYWDAQSIEFDTLDKFLDFHDQFSLSQGLKKINRHRIKSYLDAGIFDLSLVKSQDGIPLTWHGHCCVRNRACFLYSASIRDSKDTSYQSLVGRTNRYHHWQDMLRFKKSGISVYDFGGWYAGDIDKKLLNINKFKEEFGGEVVQNFKALHGVTLKGKLFVFLYKLRAKMIG